MKKINLRHLGFKLEIYPLDWQFKCGKSNYPINYPHNRFVSIGPITFAVFW